jgi:hypothetical protein
VSELQGQTVVVIGEAREGGSDAGEASQAAGRDMVEAKHVVVASA